MISFADGAGWNGDRRRRGSATGNRNITSVGGSHDCGCSNADINGGANGGVGTEIKRSGKGPHCGEVGGGGNFKTRRGRDDNRFRSIQPATSNRKSLGSGKNAVSGGKSFDGSAGRQGTCGSARGLCQRGGISPHPAGVGRADASIVGRARG